MLNGAGRQSAGSPGKSVLLRRVVHGRSKFPTEGVFRSRNGCHHPTVSAVESPDRPGWWGARAVLVGGF